MNQRPEWEPDDEGQRGQRGKGEEGRAESEGQPYFAGKSERRGEEMMKKEQDREMLAIGQLADVLGIETEMGLVYLAQVLRNARLFERKQKDYGSGNIAVFGEKGVIVRASDKVQRLKHLVFDKDADAPVQNEPVADSWDDLANYGVIGRLCADGKWK